MKKFISIILILVALFGLVASGLAVKDTLDTKKHYEDAGKINDENLEALKGGLDQLEENEAAYLEGRDAYEAGLKQYEEGKATYEAGKEQLEAGKASLEQARALVEGLDQVQTGYASWAEGYNGLNALAQMLELEAPSAENVATYDAVIEQAGLEELKGVPQAIADGQKQLSDGLGQIISGVMADETMAASVEQASGMTADQINQTMAALGDLPYDQFNGAMTSLTQLAASLGEGVKAQLADGEQQLADAEAQLAAAEPQLADAEKQLADGKAQLDQFEAGRDQITAGLDAAIANPADPGLKSIADRLGEGFTYLKENGKDLDISKGRDVWNAWKAYSDDSGDAITKEVITRVVGIALTLLGSLLALFAGIKGLGGKGGKLLPFVAALLGCGGFVALLIGGDFYTKGAGVSGTNVTLLLVGACAVAVFGLARALTAKKQ